MQVVDGGVEWPGSEAVERMGKMGITPKWLDEAIEIILKDSIQ